MREKGVLKARNILVRLNSTAIDSGNFIVIFAVIKYLLQKD